MKVTFPHMGHMWVSVKSLLEGFGLDVVVPPPCTKKTLSLGTRHAPECICLPLKINLGNYIEASEKGADTIVMAGGVGPCRFGYYSRLEKEILDDLGYEMDMIILEPPERHLLEIIPLLRRLARCGFRQAAAAVNLAWMKCCIIDLLEQEVQKVRAVEKRPGESDAVLKEAVLALDAAQTLKAVARAKNEAFEALRMVSRETASEALRIAIVGEIYTILEPFVNLDTERHLGRMGVQTCRSLYLSQWVNDHLLGGILPMPGCREACSLSAPYLNSFVGGHGRESVGCTVQYARSGFDGVIQLAPLTCGPEIVAEAVLPKVSIQEKIPVMTLYLDEQTGEAGHITRLEAFVDMIRNNKYYRKLEC